MAFVVGVESPLSDEMRVLIGELNTVLLALSPPEHCHHMSVEEMAGDDTTVFVARDPESGAALGCGALRRHGDGIGEVKRMYTREAARGLGVGGEILGRLEALAREEGLRELVLETGDRHEAAWRIYERGGFSRCPPVLDYPDTPFSVFYCKVLGHAGEALRA